MIKNGWDGNFQEVQWLGLCAFTSWWWWSLSQCLTLETPWTVACQVPLSIGFSRQEYWSGLPFPSPGHLPEPGIESGSPTFHTDSSPTELPGKPSFLGASFPRFNPWLGIKILQAKGHGLKKKKKTQKLLALFVISQLILYNVPNVPNCTLR